MATFHISGVAEFNRRFPRDMKQRRRRIVKAVKQTAFDGKKVVKQNVPVAFAELKGSIHSTDDQIIADAPHAAAVEVGSRPHMPPIEPLIAWVKLRAAQGLLSDSALRKRVGSTTFKHARTVAAQILDRRLTDGSDAIAVDAPEQIAWEIALAIKARGTKPHFYMGQSVPAVVEILDEQVRSALPDP